MPHPLDEPSIFLPTFGITPALYSSCFILARIGPVRLSVVVGFVLPEFTARVLVDANSAPA